MYSLGIIGFGVVGLAGLNFFIRYPDKLRSFLKLSSDCEIKIFVWDKKEVTTEQKVFFAASKVVWLSEEECSLADFITRIDRALVSPGVSLGGLCTQEQNKIFCELDLFTECFLGYSIAITGSLGKTTVTKLIYQIFKHYQESINSNLVIALGGNVGIGMLDLLQDNQADWAVLELSSYQLEKSNFFAPTVGVWTNLYANHLDRHRDLEGYFMAKAKLIKTMHPDGMVVLGAQLFNQTVVSKTLVLISNIENPITIAGDTPIYEHIIGLIPRRQLVMWSVREKLLIKEIINQDKSVNVLFSIDITQLPVCTFVENWATIFATLDSAGVDLSWLAIDIKKNPGVYRPNDHKHRVELIRQYRGVDVYNDSKSTVQEATLAAVQQLALHYPRIYVLIGGVGKGVDRSEFGMLLKEYSQVAGVFAFGKEAEMLGVQDCSSTLEEAVVRVLKKADSGDAILFSPGGASFDLFKNYEQRGDRFREIIDSLPI